MAQTELPAVVISRPATPFGLDQKAWDFRNADGSVKPAIDRQTFRVAPVTALQADASLQIRESGSNTLSIRGSQQADRVLQLLDFVPLNDGDGLGAPPLFLARDFWQAPEFIKGPADSITGRASFAGAARYKFINVQGNRAQLRHAAGAPSGSAATAVQLMAELRADGASEPSHSSSTSSDHRADQSSTRDSNFIGYGFEDKPEIFRAGLKSKTHHVAFQRVLNKWKVLGLFGDAEGSTPGPQGFNFQSTYASRGGLAGAAFTNRVQTGVESEREFQFTTSASQLAQKFDQGTANPSESVTSNLRVGVAVDDVHPAWSLRLGGEVEQRALKATYSGTEAYTETPISGQLRFSLSPLKDARSWQTYFGARYEGLTGFWLPSIETQWRSSAKHYPLIDFLMTFLRWSEGSRRPSLSDRFASVSYFRGNPELRSERSRSLEAGFSTTVPIGSRSTLDRANLSGTWFRTQMDNLFESQVISPGVQSRINAGAADSEGFELNASLEYLVWELDTSVTWLEARDRNSLTPMRLAPRQQLSQSLSRRIGRSKIELRATSWSEFFDRDVISGANVRLAPFTVWDLTIGILGYEDLEVRFLLSNLTNIDRELTIGYPEPGRTAHLSLSMGF